MSASSELGKSDIEPGGGGCCNLHFEMVVVEQ